MVSVAFVLGALLFAGVVLALLVTEARDSGRSPPLHVVRDSDVVGDVPAVPQQAQGREGLGELECVLCGQQSAWISMGEVAKALRGKCGGCGARLVLAADNGLSQTERAAFEGIHW